MIRYEVTLDVAGEGPLATLDAELAERLETYMRWQHIPEILATGCFADIRFDRAGPLRFRTVYHADAPADLDRYLAEHSPRLRADFAAHFPHGVTATREHWVELQRWERADDIDDQEP